MDLNVNGLDHCQPFIHCKMSKQSNHRSQTTANIADKQHLLYCHHRVRGMHQECQMALQDWTIDSEQHFLQFHQTKATNYEYLTAEHWNRVQTFAFALGTFWDLLNVLQTCVFTIQTDLADNINYI